MVKDIFSSSMLYSVPFICCGCFAKLSLKVEPPPWPFFLFCFFVWMSLKLGIMMAPGEADTEPYFTNGSSENYQLLPSCRELSSPFPVVSCELVIYLLQAYI